MKLILPLALALLMQAPHARAAVFDAADTLPPNAAAVGGLAEIMIADPTSEGVEAHGRYGLDDAWNLGGFFGTGTKNKKFRMGGEAVYNLLPDWAGQMGFSLLGSTSYIRRNDGGGVQFSVAPMVHKRFTGWGGYPANVYAAIPWNIDIRGSNLTTGSQIVVGSDFDISDGGRYYMDAELGLRLAKADSYVVFGMGMRLGDLSFTKKGESKKTAEKKTTDSKEKELTDEDFKK